LKIAFAGRGDEQQEGPAFRASDLTSLGFAAKPPICVIRRSSSRSSKPKKKVSKKLSRTKPPGA